MFGKKRLVVHVHYVDKGKRGSKGKEMVETYYLPQSRWGDRKNAIKLPKGAKMVRIYAEQEPKSHS